jgi:pimeloyl-ACP methyl ester carboxylesterase
MLDIEGVFDHATGRTKPGYGQLLREIGSAFTYFPPPPDPAELPPGGGHVVLVIPAFLVGDSFSAPLTRFLDRCGYRAQGWELGINWGPTQKVMHGLRRRFAALREQADGPISLIGISLGGLMARYLAYDYPRDVRQVITLASPYNLPTASTLEPLIRVGARYYSSAVVLARLAEPLPVPATSLFTRDDAVVAWESCFDEQTSAIDVGGPHILICRNPKALRAVAQSLAAGNGGAALSFER